MKDPTQGNVFQEYPPGKYTRYRAHFVQYANGDWSWTLCPLNNLTLLGFGTAGNAHEARKQISATIQEMERVK